jgi:hypothetical protein
MNLDFQRLERVRAPVCSATALDVGPLEQDGYLSSLRFLGLIPVELVVTPETLMVVGDKEGGFADIREGERVVGIYEARLDTLWAKRVEVFVQAAVGP